MMVVWMGGGGGTTVNVSSSSATTATMSVGRLEEDVVECMECLMMVLDYVLVIVFEGGLCVEFGEVWMDMLYTSSSWTLETTLREFKVNWGLLFFM